MNSKEMSNGSSWGSNTQPNGRSHLNGTLQPSGRSHAYSNANPDRISRWQMHRAGLLNFWYYDDEMFSLADGKLLLRGSNGSGKSVTMQSLIPILLDGRKSADRLDPFGSRARKMEDYLLGEKDVVDRDERTGYLYLEYKRSDSEQYVTTGIGLRAKRQANMEFWGFVITDNRRIGENFSLYKSEYNAELGEEQKIPLTRRELEHRLQEGGKVVRGQKEYMELVNKHVFGFESLEAYEELIKLLIQLRSPKLSKEFKPTVIYEILNESLPALSDDELRPLSDTIENMDQTKQQLDQLLRDQEALERLNKHYDDYNEYVLAEKAEGFVKAEQKQRQLNSKKGKLEKEIEQERAQEQEAAQQFTALQQEQEVLQEEKRELDDHDVVRAQEDKVKVEKTIRATQDQLSRKDEQLEQKKRKERQLQSRMEESETKKYEADQGLSDALAELDFLAENAHFDAHDLSATEFKKTYAANDYDFILWKKEAHDYERTLTDLLQVIRQKSKSEDRYEQADRELSEATKTLDLTRREEAKWLQVFEEEKQHFLEIFHHWRKENQELQLGDEATQLTAQRIGGWFEPYRSEEVKAGVAQAYDDIFYHLETENIQAKHRLQLKQEEIQDKEAHLAEWKEKQESEPERQPDTMAAREKLEAEGIGYIPFFSAVEFQEHVSHDVRERVESAITHMGLLDALIVPEAQQSRIRKKLGSEVQANAIIRPDPQLLGHTLADVLYATPTDEQTVSAEDIDNVLRSILIGDEGAFGSEKGFASINEQGRYHIGLLEAHAPRSEQSRYIGKEARKAYRLQMIRQLEEELEQLQQEYAGLEEEREHIVRRIDILKEEYARFPAEDQVREAYDSLDEIRRDLKSKEKDVDFKNEKVKEAAQELQAIKNELRERTADMSLQVDEVTFSEACSVMSDYRNQLQELQLFYKDYVTYRDRLVQYASNLEEMQADVDELQGEVNVLEADIEKWNMRLEQIEARLQELGAAEIQEKIAYLTQRLSAIPDELIACSTKQTNARNRMDILHQEVQQVQYELTFMSEMVNKWQDVFLQDLQLNLMQEESTQATHSSHPDQHQAQGPQEENGSLAEKSPLARAKHILQHYGYLLADASIDREKRTDQLNRAFYKQQAVLVEYRLTQEDVLEVGDVPDPGEDEGLQLQVEQLRQKSRRIYLLLEYNGARVSPYYVMDHITKDIELQQSILTQKDRELYEEIIMNSVGRIIRARINRAEQWVKQINDLMEERDTSSGLTFSIRWKPRTADVEEELDTRELVDLLRADARVLKEEDIQRVTQHFRSKIERAKEVLEEKGYGETLHQAIKEILDYRKWFSFTLYYRRMGEQKKELTNNVFYTFSGGEKAMAMYIPLFSSAYSRYLEAKSDAPYIISLDEAFAGVDENNIRDMFDLVEKLGFDYIMNSQAIWGDYDTVSSLAIAELVRPKNAPYVTVIHYYWDGVARHLLHEANIEQEREQEAVHGNTEREDGEGVVVEGTAERSD